MTKHRSFTASLPPLCRKAAFVLAGSIAALLGSASAPAATIRFDGGPAGTNFTLDLPANWLGDALPVGTSEVLFEDSGFTLPAQLTTGTNLSYGDLLWNSNTSSAITINTTTATNYTLSLGGGGGSDTAILAGGASGDLLVMGTKAVDSTLTIGGNAGTGTGRLNLILGASGNFDVVNAGATLAISSVISGAFNLAKTGAGTLTLSGTNTFGSATSNFTLAAGTVNINAVAALGNSGNTFNINGGAFDNTSGTAITTSAYKQTWNSDFTFKGTNSLNLGAGAVSLGLTAGTARTVTVNGNTLTIGGVISEASGGTAKALVKDGAGTLVLNGANAFTGGVTIKNGTVVGGATAAFGTTAGTITLGDTSGSNSASLLGSPAATSAIAIANPIVIAAGSTGTMTMGNLSTTMLAVTFSGAISLGHDLMLSNAATGISSNTVTISGAITETEAGRSIVVNAGSSTVALTGANNFTGGLTLNSGRLSVGGTGATGTGVFTLNGGVLDNAGGAANATLTNSRYDWNADFSFKGTFQVTLGTGNVVLGGNRIITTTNVNSVVSSSLLINTGITDGGNGYSLTKRGASGLTLNGANTYSGATLLQEGLLNLNGAASTLANTSALTITGGTMTVGVASGAGMADRINTAIPLTIGGSGIFTLNTGATGPVNSQRFTGLSITAGSSQVGTSVLSAGAITFTGASGSVYTRAVGGTTRFVIGGSESFTNAPTGSSTIGSGSSALLIGAVTGSTAAAVTDFVKAAAGAITAPTYGTNTWGTGVNSDATISFDATGNTQSLRYNTSSRVTTTLTGTSIIESGGILLGSTASGGAIVTGGTLLASAGKDLWVYTSTTATAPQGLTIQSPIADNVGSSLTKSGPGKLSLTNAANSYTGGTYLGEGILNVVSAGALGTGALNFTGNATLQAGGATVNLASRAINIGYGQMATFDTNGAANVISSSGVISGGGGLTKTGNGTLTLSGANTYAGPTIINGGTLKLDFSAPGAPTNDIISSSSLFNPGGGGLLISGAFSQSVVIQGKESTANSQTFGGTYTNALANPDTAGMFLGRGMTRLVLAAGTGGTLTVNLGTISRGYSTDVNDLVDFNIGTGVTVQVGNAAGLLGGYATVNGNTWATVIGGVIVPYTTFATSYSSSGSAIDVGAGGTLTVNVHSLRFNGNNAATVVPGAGVLRTLNSGGILVTSAVGANLSTIAAGVLTGVSARDIIIHQNNPDGDLQIDANIVDVGARTMTIAKSGVGKLILTASNTTTGSTFVNEGTLVVLGDAVASFTKTATSTSGSAVLNMTDTSGIYLGQAVTQATALTAISTTWTVVAINPGVSVTLSNNAGTALTGTFTFGAGGGLGVGLVSHYIAPGATLQIGNGGTTGSLAVGQPISNNGSLILNRSTDSTLASIVSGLGNLEKLGAGNTTLTGASTFTGDTKISGGSLILGVATALGGSTLDYGSYGGALSFGSLTAATLGALKGSQNLVLTNASAAAVALTVGGNHQDTTYSGALSGLGAISKTGGGTMTLSGANTYAGGTTVSQGTLNITGSLTDTLSITVSGGVMNLSGVYTRSTYSQGAGLTVSDGIFNVTGTLGSLAVPLGQTAFSGNSVTNLNGNVFLSGASSTFRVGEASSATVNVLGGTLTIGTSSSGVALGRSNAAARGFLNISGGTMTLTANTNGFRVGAGFVDTETSGASAVTISGTGLLETGVTTGTILLGSNLAGNSASSGTLNLDGGSLATLRTILGGSVGSGIVNFNGGTLKANGVSMTINLGALGVANVRNGGAVIDTNGYDVSIAQPLVHSTVVGDSATDGGLTKKGGGKLTLSGANTFTGALNVNDGSLAMTGVNTLAGPIAVNNAATLSFNGGNSFGGGVTVNAGGTLTVDGANSFTGSVTSAGTMTVSGGNSFSGNVAVSSGTMTVNDTNTFTGRVDVNAGTLLVSGSISGGAGAAGVKVAAGASLITGSGTTIKTAANGNFDIGGTLSPGDFGTPRALTLDPGTGAKLNFLSGSTFKFDIGLTTNSSDRVLFSSVGNWLSGSGNVTLELNEIGIGIDYGGSYVVFGNVNTGGFHFANITGYDNENFFANVDLVGNNYVLTFAEVPEPGSAASLLGGLSLLVGLHRFRRRRSGQTPSAGNGLTRSTEGGRR